MQTFSQLLSILDWIQEHHKPPWSSTLLENTAFFRCEKLPQLIPAPKLPGSQQVNKSTQRAKKLAFALALALAFSLALGSIIFILALVQVANWEKNVKQSIEMSYFKQLISWYLSVRMHNIEISGICTVGNCTKHLKFRWKGVVKTCWHFLSKTYLFLVESMKTLEMSTGWRGFHNWYYNNFWLKISGIFKRKCILYE